MRLITLAKGSRQVRIWFDYDREIVEEVKTLPDRKFFKKDGTAYWSVPMEYHKEIMEFAHAFGFTVGDEVKRAIRMMKTVTAENVQIPNLPEAYLKGRAVTIGERTLFTHQVEGVKYLTLGVRAILADDMGLGKTTQALVAAHFYRLPIVVICPVSLKVNWWREADIVGVHITEIFSWAKFPESLLVQGKYKHGFVAIFDEAHYAQAGTKSQRGERFLSLSKEATALFLLTGTPLKNGKPINLMPLLQAIQHPITKNKSAYQVRYCDAHATPWSRWDVSGAKNLDELHEKTKDKILRRTKAQCLDLPPFMRAIREAEISTKAQEIFDARLKELRLQYMDRLNAGLVSHGAEELVALTQIRQAASMAKVDTTVELALEVIEQGSKVVIFTAFKEPAHALNGAIVGSVVMLGDTPPQVRQEIIDDFQAGKYTALITTFGTGGIGINLQSAQTVILQDRPWTPADADQAESRLHRFGQTGSVQSIWVQYGETDADIDAMLQSKERRIELVLNGERKTMSGTMSASDIASVLVPKIFNLQEMS
jgi:SNF2 family DNA or RNA helicase